MPNPRRGSFGEADSRPAWSRPPRPRGGLADDDDDDITPVTPKRTSRPKAKESPATSPKKKTGERSGHKSGEKSGNRTKRHSSTPHRSNPPSPSKTQAKHASGASYNSTSQLLSVDSLAKLNAVNEKSEAEKVQRKRKEKQYKNVGGQTRKKKNRNVSGARMEEGRVKEKHSRPRPRGGGAGSVKEYVRKRRKGGEGPSKRCWILLLVALALILIIAVSVGVVVAGKKKSGQKASSAGPNKSNLDGVDPNSIPVDAKGSETDPFSWYDTSDFNVTYTGETVGGLSVMGLMSEWDDSNRPNSNVPPISDSFPYGKTPIRGVNVGGWLSIEPFITPSLFNQFSAAENVVDEYTLTAKLGIGPAKNILEAHYATFVTEQTFIDIADAGMDHVRIPFSYWAVTTYPGDPYIPKTSWRYLLRGIEWARKHGLRVNLDLHGLPGSQNGWNHSGRFGAVGWLNGNDGALNAKRSLEIHDQLSQFFAQARYKNVVTIYGLANEPKMLLLPSQAVLDWNKQAVDLVRGNGLKQYIAIGDGFLGLDKWSTMGKGVDDKLILDTHQYVIFNVEQLAFSPKNKINMACQGWSKMLERTSNPSTG